MTTVLHSPPNDILRIDEIWAFVSCDETGEGICAAPLLGPGSVVPLIAADKARLKSIMSVAQQLATASGKTVKLVKFTVREEVEEIAP
jgi:hypothetical protein